MILVDTSVWVTHLRRGEPDLVSLLEQTRVLVHPFVVGELALGNLQHRPEILAAMENLPAARVATHREVMTMIDERDLVGCGVGWVDAHLLASALLSRAALWSHDRKLSAIAGRLDLTPR